MAPGRFDLSKKECALILLVVVVVEKKGSGIATSKGDRTTGGDERVPSSFSVTSFSEEAFRVVSPISTKSEPIVCSIVSVYDCTVVSSFTTWETNNEKM